MRDGDVSCFRFVRYRRHGSESEHEKNHNPNPSFHSIHFQGVVEVDGAEPVVGEGEEDESYF